MNSTSDSSKKKCAVHSKGSEFEYLYVFLIKGLKK